MLRVSSLEFSQRKRNALIGLAIGAAAGAAIGLGLAVGTGGGSFFREGAAPFAGLGLAVGAGGGAALGYAVPSYPTIYRSERRKDQTAP